TRLETGFLPEMDEGGFVLDYRTAPGTSLAETDRMVRGLEERIAKIKEVDAFSRRTGAELGFFVTEQNKGDILVKMKPRSQRARSRQEVISDLRGEIEHDVAGVEVEFVQILQDMIGDLGGSPEPVEVKLFGDSMSVLEQVAGEIGPRIQKIPGIVDFKAIARGNPEIVFTVDPARAGRVGLTVDQVSQQVSAGLLGLAQTSFRKADRLIDIRVRFPDRFRFDYAMIRQFPVVTAAKAVVPLESLADLGQTQGAAQLSRENQRLMVTLTARLENRDLGSVIGDVKKLLRQTRLPHGTTYEIGGQYESQQASFRELFRVMALALAAVFAVIVGQFRRFLPAVII